MEIGRIATTWCPAVADLAYGVGAYRREDGNLPELQCFNMWVEPTPAAEKGIILQSRPGLLSTASRGNGPVQGVFQKDGVFGGDVFTISGNNLYRAGTLLGTLTGSGPASFAASSSELVVTLGASAYSYNGTDLQAVAFPDSALVTAVAFLAGYFIYLRAGSHRFYWSAMLDGRTIDGADFASAESAPDALLDVKTIGDEVWFIGSETIEPWQTTGEPEIPFIRSQGRLYRKGAIGSGCSQEVDNTLFLITNQKAVARAADTLQFVSDAGIEERLKASSEFETFAFRWQGHEFFGIRYNGGGTLPNGTQQQPGTHLYDIATRQWCEIGSHGRDNFRGRCAVDLDGDPLFGDDENGTLWGFSAHEDAGGVLERRFTAAATLEAPAKIRNLLLHVNVGQTPYLTGDYSEPVIEVRSSRDAGQTKSEWRPTPLGAQGQYRKRTAWRRFGTFDAPGAVFEFRCTAPVPLRISAVKANVPLTGRGR